MQFLPQYCPLLEKVTLSPNCGPQTCIHPEEKKGTPLKRHPDPGREKEALKLFSESISSQNVGEDKPGGRVLVSQPRSRAGQEKNSGEFWIVQS